MKKQIITTLLLFFTALLDAQDILPLDTSIRQGKLPNGLTYYVRRNAQTPQIADFYIAQRVGSILEEKRQRGLAHFLEHMAFNGTQNFPGDSLHPGIVQWCERVGIKFGQNLNAYTSVDETVYNISSAPTAREGVVDSCLLILHDWSHFLLLSDKEIDKERGVVHEEWRTRRSGMAVQRLMEEAMPVIYGGSKYENCLPIGNMDVVDHFPYKDLRDYYAKWYRPDLQAIIVVGDVDVDKIEQKIRSLFGSIPVPAHPAERIYYPIGDNDSTIVFTAKDKEQPTVNFSLYMKRAATPRAERNTWTDYADGYRSGLVSKMLNDRLKEIMKQTNPPFLSAFVRDGSFFVSNTKSAFTASLMCKQDSILCGISALVAEMERARTGGFTSSELARAKAEQMRYAEDAYNDRNKERNAHYVRLCLRHFLDGDPMMSAEEELKNVKKLNAEITLADIDTFVRKLIFHHNEVVTIYGPDKEGFEMPTHQEITECIEKAQSKQYVPYIEKPLPAKLIAREPQSGKIVAEKNWRYGYRQLILSNGMKVYVRPTDFEADEVNFNAFSPGGKSLYADSEMPSLDYMTSSIQAGGIGSFDAISLDKMLDGKTVSMTPYISDEEEGMSGSSNVKNMKELFQLAYLYFTSPRRDVDAFTNLMNRQRSFLTNREANPNVSYNDSIVAILYGNNPRMAPIKKETLSQVNYNRILQIYKERFGDASDFSVVLTGNIDLKVLRPLVCKYLASLPHLERNEKVQDRHVYVREVDETHQFRKQEATPSSLTTIFLTAKMSYDADNDLKLDVLSQILRMMYTDKVREEQGGTYGVSVDGDLQRYPLQKAFLKIKFRTDPSKYDTLIPIVYKQLHVVADKGPEDVDLNKVKEYLVKTYNQEKITNDYWYYIAYKDLVDHVDFDTDYVQKVQKLSAKDIRNFARSILNQKQRIEITMTSK